MAVYEDSEGRGFFAECEVCEARGPLREAPRSAREALRGLARVARPHGQGGVREGVGRPRELQDARTCAFSLCSSHLRKLDALAAEFNRQAATQYALPETKHRSATLRAVLNLPTEALVELLLE